MYIKSIIVKNFRTLQKDHAHFELEFNSEFQIIAGANNSGKSNLLRALNLFFNESADDGEPYDREKDLPFHKGKYGTGSPVNTEIEVDLYLTDEEINKISNLKNFVTDNHTIKTKRTYRENDSGWYTANQDGKFSKNLNDNAVKHSDPISILFRRIKFIYIPTHADLKYKINELVADEILPSMVDGYGNSGLAQKIKKLKTDLDGIDLNIKDILKEKNALISKNFQETIAEFPEIQSGMPINEFALEVALNSDNITSILSKRIELLVRDSAHNTIDSKGSGIQKIVLITLLDYFSQNVVEKARFTNPFLIWAIDEPESFLQPKLQKKLREILQKVSKTHQIIISTHSPKLIDIFNPSNVKLFYLKTAPFSVIRKNKIIFKKETNYWCSNDQHFIEKLKEHLGIEINDGWILQNKNILFEGSDDVKYFHSTYRALIGTSLSSSDISCESSNNMPAFAELLHQKISNKKLKDCSLLCLLDDDSAGRAAHKKLKIKKYVKSFKTISMYLNKDENDNENYPKMIEDLIIPEVYFESLISFLTKIFPKTKLNHYKFKNFFLSRKSNKRSPMPEFLDNHFDPVIKTKAGFTFSHLHIKYGIALEYEDIISKKNVKDIKQYEINYPTLSSFLLLFN